MDGIQPGQTLGPYRIISQVGQGGMATVYKAYQAAVDRFVALKVLPRYLSETPEFTERFRREARIIARLEHARILPVYDAGEQDGMLFLVMRYMETGTLTARIAKGALSWAEVDHFFCQLAEALNYAHTHGVIHRDLKPSNVLVDAQDDIYLTDFGIAKVLEGGTKLTGTGAFIGTPAYMSPEQAQGLPADQRSDIYALGIILYELITGRVPFEAATPLAVIFMHLNEPLPLPSSIRPDMPPVLEPVLLKALSKSPEDRYASAEEFLSAWKLALAEGRTGPAPQPVAVTPPQKSVETRPQHAGQARRRAMAGAALLGLLLLGLFLFRLAPGALPVSPTATLPMPNFWLADSLDVSDALKISDAQMLAAGSEHTCALVADGGVMCWGKNALGQLGTGDTTDQRDPVSIAGLNGVNMLALGAEHSCARLVSAGTGQVLCWGHNHYGQLGSGDTLDALRPQAVRGLAKVENSLALVAGAFHTCVLSWDGQVTCWGYNSDGQLGDGSTVNRPAPVTVGGLPGVSALAAGDLFTCALSTQGAVLCWGKNDYGQLGDGSLVSHAAPVEVVGLGGAVRQVTAGWYHACALRQSGEVLCWGKNASGQLGSGDTQGRSMPAQVRGLTGEVLSLSAGGEHTCALLTNGAVMCWGGNTAGQLGGATRLDSPAPQLVPGLSEVSGLAAGGYHTCVIIPGGGVKCWGLW